MYQVVREVSQLDRFLIIVGMALLGLGVGLLVVAPSMLAMRDPFVLGGLLLSVIGGITILVGRSVNRKKNQRLGALR